MGSTITSDPESVAAASDPIKNAGQGLNDLAKPKLPLKGCSFTARTKGAQACTDVAKLYTDTATQLGALAAAINEVGKGLDATDRKAAQSIGSGNGTGKGK